MNISQALMVIEAAAIVNDTVLMTGKHGIGKSAVPIQFAKKNKYHFEPLFISNQEVGDLIGMPDTIEIDGKKITTWSVPPWLKRMRDNAANGIHSVLFLDEFNRGPLDVRQACLQLVLEGRIHEHELPVVNGKKTLVVAAVNPSDGYQVEELDPALLDRFTTIEVESDAVCWLKWAAEENVNPIVRSYIAEHPDYLHWTPKDGGKGSTNRAWTRLGDYLDNADKIPEEILPSIIKGRIGSHLQGKFFVYYKNYIDVIKIEDIEKLVSENEAKTSSIEELGEMLAKLMSKAEAIQKSEMINQLASKYMTEKFLSGKGILPFLAFLYGMETEITLPFLKSYKTDNKVMYDKLAQIDLEINKKRLFHKFLNASKQS